MSERLLSEMSEDTEYALLCQRRWSYNLDAATFLILAIKTDVQEPTLSLGVCGSFPHMCSVHASTDALSTVVSCTTVWGSHFSLITRTNS